MSQPANLHSRFEASARENGSKTALFWAEAEYSYADFWEQAARVSQALRERHHVQPGERVGIWLRNRPEFISALFGILGANAVAVPINTFLKPEEVAYQLQDADARTLITESALWEGARDRLQTDLQDANPVLLAEDFPTLPALTASTGSHRQPDDLAVLIYTSGTTGRPKGAMLSHRNLMANVESCRQVLGAVDFDRFVLLLPMFHSFMLTVCVLLPLSVGGSIVLIKDLGQPKQMVAEMLRRHGTVLPAIAALFRALAQLPAGIQLPLRLCLSGAGPLPAEILRAFNERHPRIPLIEGYGLSEASPVVSVNPVLGPHHPGTIGTVIPGVELTVQSEDGALLPDLVPGELCVRGDNVMQGYWKAPEKTAETLVGGWLRTGDIGHRRPDGWFVITDRKKDLLKPNGINVYPREIEEAIQSFPGVKECAVVGEPDERRGERPVAFVALDEDSSAARAFSVPALLAQLRGQLADFKLPRRVLLWPSLPRNAAGKILKTTLRDHLAAGRE